MVCEAGCSQSISDLKIEEKEEMARTFKLEPREVAKVNTKWRKIATMIPVPESIPALEKLRKYEPVSMSGQPLVVWDRGEGCNIYDRWGNKWLDWSSGVVVANAGHGRKEIIDAIVKQATHGLLHNYCFPSEVRGNLAEKLVGLAPKGIDKCFILTTGAETTECALKLTRTHGHKVGGKKKNVMVSFENAFHGRTLGAQMMGGMGKQKTWILNHDLEIVQIPFPDGFWNTDTNFKTAFLGKLAEKGVTPDRVAGVITESFQGAGADFAPAEYMQELRAWCDEHNIVLTMDEVQAGFGRSGKFWSFEHYGIVPDLICMGKGISSSLPISGLMGKAKIMDLYGPNEMTSTHTGNPVCSVAAMASIDIIVKEKLVQNAEKMGKILHAGLDKVAKKHADVVGVHHGKGMVAGLAIVKPGTKEKDGDLAWDIVNACVEKGLLMFAPVGGSTVKIAPPLMSPQDAIEEGLEVLEEAFTAALGMRK